MLYIGLYQTRRIEHMWCPVFGNGCEVVADSAIAHPFGIPDGFLGIASYGVTLVLAVLACRSKRAGKLLGAKLLLDGGAATFNASRQIVRFGKLCSWCTATAVATGVMVYAGRQFVSRLFSNR